MNIGAIKTNGDFYIWGSEVDGFLGKKPEGGASFRPIRMMRDVKDVSMEYGHVLVLKKDGSVWAWGSNDGYAISKDYGKGKIITKPIKIASNVKAITTGYGFSVILKKDGRAYWKGTMQ